MSKELKELQRLVQSQEALAGIFEQKAKALRVEAQELRQVAEVFIGLERDGVDVRH